jgi:hypothetical protein
VLFLGTPHRGSSKAETGEMLRRIASASGFSTSDRNLQALHIDSSELEGIHERFMKLRKQNQWHFEVRTFQEAKGMTSLNFLGLGEKVSQSSCRVVFTICLLTDLGICRLSMISRLRSTVQSVAKQSTPITWPCVSMLVSMMTDIRKWSGSFRSYYSR